MNTKLYEELYSNLTRKLLNIKWLNKIKIKRSMLDEYISSDNFSKQVKSVIETNDFSCAKVLNICKGFMELLSPEPKPEDWLFYIYQYALNKTFPDAVTISLNNSLDTACEFYLKVLKIVNDAQKKSSDNSWQSKYPITFLTDEEEEALESTEEFKKFIRTYKRNYIYEMMKLNGEIFKFNTLDHICGVHYLALYIARQLKALGLAVDLGRVSGAAAGHDIGKYGCKQSELKRVPYLHYYYTDQWFKKLGINYIRNIAVKHSTWDLELENLSLESLILIYADFRVKNRTTDSGIEMHVFSLKDSFNVILEKLDNVDAKKEKRYKRVYEKLKDFEDYLISLGVTTSLEVSEQDELQKSVHIRKNYALSQGSLIVQNLKYLSINHNINLMYQLRDETSLEEILERARSEKDWKNFREYIRTLEEYSTYLTQSQKLQTIKFLFENFVHPEDDIRRHCAELLGTLIAIFDEDYGKELPLEATLENPEITSFELLKYYINELLYPGHKVIATHKFWLGYNLSFMISALFANCSEKSMPGYRKVIAEFYDETMYKNFDNHIFLLESAKYIPLTPYDEELYPIFNYILHMLKKHNSIIRLSALENCIEIVPKVPEESGFLSSLREFISLNLNRSKQPSENLLKLKLARQLSENMSVDILSKYCIHDEKYIQEIFLSNLKTDTEWVKKQSQITLLLEYALKDPKSNGLHTAIHFCNILKVSAIEKVRNEAGSAILSILPYISLAQRNEVAVELLRALEIEGNRFTEYIPHYVGQIILYLQPKELNEIIDDLFGKIKSSTPNVKSLILKTIGISISNYPNYKERFSEPETSYNTRLINMLGILLNGLSDYNLKTKQSAFSVIGKDIFGTKYLNLIQKESIFTLIGKKILTLITDSKNEELLFLTNSAALNHIYRFISDYSFFYGNIKIEAPKKVAFFPGTFDPFSLSHKEICKAIRDKGFEVYLAVDEFSWSKKTLPNLLRRNILNMSIASELNIYIYPDIYPTNIASIDDLNTLKGNFPDSEVYIAVGSDVVLNASSYKSEKMPDSIHSFNHIIFERGRSKKVHECTKNIDGKIEWLMLPSKYSDISSTQIRKYIDENRDISSLIDELSQQYIYENGFYQKEPQDKSMLSSLWLKIEVIEEYSDDLIKALSILTNEQDKVLSNELKQLFSKPSGRIILVKNSYNNDEILGFSTFYWIRSGKLYEEIQNDKLSQYIRDNSFGRIVLLNSFFIKSSDKNSYLEQILLTETLAFCIAKDYQYAIVRNTRMQRNSSSMSELLKLQGFIELDNFNDDLSTYIVDMSSPCILNLDLENIIKEPFRSNLRIRQTIISTRKKLQEALIRLYPGELLLIFDSSMLHQSMIRKICSENGVSTTISEPKKLGPSMCVPYGDILDRYVIPNTVTKALHTEKYFNPDIKGFRIAESPYYLNLETQVKMLRSFNRPVILVDNILHKGYRMKALDPLFKNENIKVQKILAGILSGRGKDLMDMQNREVDSVYFIPRLKLWFNENSLYPFIGGDSLWRGQFPERNLLPSINLIMPYTSPTFIRNSNITAVYNLSKVCIENAIEIITSLEDEYHKINEKNLSLHYLGQVFTIPRCPDHGKDMEYDLNLSPSLYLKNDFELLNRFENIINLK